MPKKLILLTAVLVALLAFGAWGVWGQGGQEFEPVPIFTTASDVVGVGTYVAGEAYAVAAGEDPEAEPMQALILPYSIYPNMQLTDIADFVQPEAAVEGYTFAWSLVAPDDSAAEVTGDPVAIFRADVAGDYELTLTATNADGATAETTWLVRATTYQGNGFLDGPEAAETQCVDCHDERVAEWSETKHASTLARALDGGLGDHFGPDCVSCHSTGFNNLEGAGNGGFDDLVAQYGWTMPETLEAGNWDAMVADFPEVAGLANVQCEACHGPGYLHVFEGGRRDTMISRGLDYGVCAQCHAEEPFLNVPLQWEVSAHADKNAEAFWYPIGEDRAACVRCHSGEGYIDNAAGLAADEQRFGYQVITCAVCHDTHNASNPNQLRVFDTATLPDGTEITDAGPAATCISCHNARRDPVATIEGALGGGNFSTPHYSTAGELMYARGGYTWGENMPTSTHGRVVEGECIGCHMAATPGTTEGGEALPGHNTVGEHTFAMVSPVDGTENVAVCQQCHDAATSFEFEARRDYDGDGAIETNQAEVEGLRETLTEAVVAAGVVVLDHHPYYEMPENPDENLLGATWNLEFTGSGGSPVHNLRYTVSLLQLSYEKLTGEAVPNATILAPK